MEVEVRATPRMHHCFVSLPLHLMEALQGSSDKLLARAVMELRDSRDPSRRWHVAWGGACSASPFMELSDKLALSISLPDGALVLVRALRDVPTAQSAQLEPESADDWEILALNAALVEGDVLTQVGALSPGQLFPLWIHSAPTPLIFRVLSALPNSPVVWLAAGTELIVAPRQRRKPPQTMPANGTPSPISAAKAWLRVQELDPSLAQTVNLGLASYIIFPTTAVFVSAYTAAFTDGCLVTVTASKKAEVPPDSPREKEQVLDAGKEDVVDDRLRNCVVMRLVHCNLVAKGHVMMASSICMLLGAQIHSRVQVKACENQPDPMKPFMILSPTKFKYQEGNSAMDHDNGNVQHVKETQKIEWFPEDYDLIWKEHVKILGISRTDITLSEFKDNQRARNFFREQLSSFIKVWLAAQLVAIAGCFASQCESVPITREVVMQFQLSTTSSSGLRIQGGSIQLHKKRPMDAFFVLRVCDESAFDRNGRKSSTFADLRQPSYSLLKKGVAVNATPWQLEGKQSISSIPETVNAMLGEPCYLLSLLSREVQDSRTANVALLTWLEATASEAFTRLKVLLSPEAREKSRQLDIPSPGFLLLHGPPACGKTKLALALASRLQSDPFILAHQVIVRCAELAGEQAQTIRASIQNAILEALEHAPSLIILDDLDKIIPSGDSDNSEPTITSLVIAEFLADLLDLSQVYWARKLQSPIAFLAVVHAVSALPTCLCSSGRFDFHVALSPPAAKGRAELISQELVQRNVTCQYDIIAETAATCDGYDATDLELLVDRAVHAAISRVLSSAVPNPTFIATQKLAFNLHEQSEDLDEDCEERVHITGFLKEKGMELFREDFVEALKGFSPVAMRGLAKASSQSEQLGWEDVGGHGEICKALQEMLELPVKYSKIFAQAPLRLRTGVLLYGPPGCGKTYIVGAAAAACSLRFISVKGPELLNKYIGASEQAVRDVFAKATAAAPCILFFDEFDAIAPKRGHDNTGVTDRVVNQLLTELDGVEALNGVFVFAATSRPDLLDVALLRPGRLDRLLFCDFPSFSERMEVLTVHSRKLSLARDVTLDGIASLTEGYSPADLRSLLYDAELEAVERSLASSGNSMTGRPPITMEILRKVVLKSKPSVSEKEKQRLHHIYNSFLGARSISSRARDVKGKRATLA